MSSLFYDLARASVLYKWQNSKATSITQHLVHLAEASNQTGTCSA